MSEFRRHLMKAVSGGDIGWLYGYRWENMITTDDTIIRDAEYVMSPLIDVSLTESNIYFWGGSPTANENIAKEYNSEGTCIDYWRVGQSWTKINQHVGTTTKIRVCFKISYMATTSLLYLPSSGPTDAITYILGSNMPSVVDSINRIYNYYMYKRTWEVSTGDCTTGPLALDLSETNWNQVYCASDKLSYNLDENKNYIDYWTASTTGRQITLQTNTRYFVLNSSQTNWTNYYIKYNTSGNYIWKGTNIN